VEHLSDVRTANPRPRFAGKEWSEHLLEAVVARVATDNDLDTGRQELIGGGVHIRRSDNDPSSSMPQSTGTEWYELLLEAVAFRVVTDVALDTGW